LALESNFVSAQFRAYQIYHLHTFALNRFHRRLAAKAITHAFDVQPKNGRHTMEEGGPIPRGREEHPALEEDIEQ
jgi:hypothetical protein